MPLRHNMVYSIMLGQRTTSLLRCHHLRGGVLRLSSAGNFLRPTVPRGSIRLRCVFDQMVPRLTVCSMIGAGNVIAAAGNGTAHAAVTATIAHVAVTAVAIASGACLSTKVDFLHPQEAELPDDYLKIKQNAFVLDGVDLTGYAIFNDAKVQKAIDFARKAHQGQVRRTGEPYVTHCIHTGKILAALVPSSGDRAVKTVIAGILHDVVDDTSETLHSVEEEFGDEVTRLVAGVSKLSYINQLLRRHRRKSVNQRTLSPEEANKLRVMLLGMVDDPRVVLIKLADRLHNMRTIYALSVPKAQAVAEETLSVWCSLASRLGVLPVKAELEDLCFAVLQPDKFQEMQAKLASMWSSTSKVRNNRRMATKSNLLTPLNTDVNTISKHSNYKDMGNLRDLLQAVIPFDILLDRRKRTKFLNKFRECSEVSNVKAKVVTDAGIALASLVVCEEALEQELFISTSYIPGMELTLYSRLKSLYSIYCKMKRKDVDITQIYDSRALRVIIGDRNGKLHGLAVENCYSLLNIVHRLWYPIDGEFDDYIINPKPSGYQSLHTAVHGPHNSPLEVQIRTQRMHECAEFGLAAHWLYKETDNVTSFQSDMNDSKIDASPFKSKDLEDDASVQNKKYTLLKEGHPILRVEGSQLLEAVIVSVEENGRELLVAVSFVLQVSEALANRRYCLHGMRWESYARLYKKVSDQWWFEPGHGDLSTCLEKYILCRDGIYHKQDHFQRLLPTFIQVIELTEPEESEYRTVVSAVFEGKQIPPVQTSLNHYKKSNTKPSGLSSVQSSIINKVHLLRTMLQWEEQVKYRGASSHRHREADRKVNSCDVALEEVVIICWPNGNILKMRSGSTAADAASTLGSDEKIVRLNGHLVLPHTKLKDGDIVEVRM